LYSQRHNLIHNISHVFTFELYLYRGTRFQGNLCFASRKQTCAYFSLECSFSSDVTLSFNSPEGSIQLIGLFVQYPYLFSVSGS